MHLVNCLIFVTNGKINPQISELKIRKKNIEKFIPLQI